MEHYILLIMKNLFFALAFMLVGTFAFANSEVNTITSDDVKTSIVENVIDFDFFKEMLQKGNVSEIAFKDGSFMFLDDCGNWWEVTYTNFDSEFEAFLAASEIIFLVTGC